MVLNRDNIANGFIERMLAESARDGYFQPLSPEEREASLEAALADHGPEEDIWLFGYGSLMWNPAFHFAEAAQARLRGYHRQFCLWTPVGRGSPENPGLMLALVPGGSCRGVAYRIAGPAVREELSVVWRREMVSGSYDPRWVTLSLDADTERMASIRALTFVINRQHDRFAGRLAPDRVARHVATASGRLGACREYLENTIAHLAEMGIRDRGLSDIHRRVLEFTESR